MEHATLKPASYRLGVPVKIIGAPGLRSHDSRRWQNAPHLSVSLAYLHDTFTYLRERHIRFYRLAGQLAPYITHPDLPHFHDQIEACAVELAATGDLAREQGLRLTQHPAHFIQLSSPDAAVVARSTRELGVAAALMDAMGLDDDGVIVVHVGGVYGDRHAARERFVRAIEQLSAVAVRRLALEHDDRRFSLDDALWIHQRTGVPIVFDLLHQRCLNPSGRTPAEALALALATWPAHQRPKIHVSSPRTAARHVMRNRQIHVQMPLPHQHSDFIHPFECIDLLRAARDTNLRPFDIMLEAKAKDLALLRLREQIARFAPDLAPLVW